MLLDPYLSPGTNDPRDTSARQAWQDHMELVEDEILWLAELIHQRTGLERLFVLEVLQERERVLMEADTE